VTVGTLPTGFAFDSQNDAIYVTNHGNGTVSILSSFSNTVLKTISVGGVGDCPAAGAFDPANGEVYVVDNCASTVEIIANVLPVTVTQTGLPYGSENEWGIILWNTLYGPFSLTSSVTFLEPNGTWNYTVWSDNTSYSASGGTFTVNGTGVSFSIVFHLVTYVVSFAETGLPPNTVWWVNLSGGPRFASSESTVTFLESNGTYAYSTSAAGYASSPGNLTVQGSPSGPIPVNFTALKSSPTSSSQRPFFDYPVVLGAVAVGAITVVIVRVLRRPKIPS